ncbi:hypothetical protein NL676_008009 [Syzygium grande]|nr:hypothetical protein NL676_008009 [Syzygium grande]
MPSMAKTTTPKSPKRKEHSHFARQPGFQKRGVRSRRLKQRITRRNVRATDQERSTSRVLAKYRRVKRKHEHKKTGRGTPERQRRRYDFALYLLGALPAKMGSYLKMGNAKSQANEAPNLYRPNAIEKGKRSEGVIRGVARKAVSGSFRMDIEFLDYRMPILSPWLHFAVHRLPEDLSVNVDTRPCERGSTAPSRMLFLGESAFKAL